MRQGEASQESSPTEQRGLRFSNIVGIALAPENSGSRIFQCLSVQIRCMAHQCIDAATLRRLVARSSSNCSRIAN